MALLIGPGTRVFDAAGDLISGGKIRVYNVNTTTLSSVFSDAAMAVPLTNPCVASSSGWPSSNGSTPTMIFAASGTYDVAFLDDDDNVLATFEDVPTYGEENGDFARTVTGGGRITITGSAGAVLIQAGDPTPDNSGGTLTLEGYGGSQLDSLTLDAVTTNTTGRYTEQGKKIPGVVYTDATTVTAQTSVPIALPNDPSGITVWDIDIWDLVLSGSDDAILQLSFDGGATYKTTALDYNWTRILWGTSTALAAGSGTSGAGSAYISFFLGGTAQANKPNTGRLRVRTVDSGSNYTRVNFEVEGVNSTEHFVVRGSGHTATGFGRATHIRIDTTGTNTITCKYRVVAVRGTGDA